MVNPATALLVASAIFALLAILFWPEHGLVARWRRSFQNTRRIRIEDTLKHIYDCEYRKLPCTHQSVAGVLSISRDDAADLLTRLEGMGLLRVKAGEVILTEDGRSYALRVIRVHRLWERYLADETGVRPTEWHSYAERKEHLLTPVEVDELSAQMGNPRYDPHGDPIPTATGEIPRRVGVSLPESASGDVVEIIHIEDEPDVVYAQIVALGLNPGMHVRVVEVSSTKVRFEAEGYEHVLAPIVAANVTVVPITRHDGVEISFETLDSLDIGERAEVIGISHACRGTQRRRLMDLGVLPGTVVTAEMRSASGDPTAYSIRGATIALRGQHAKLIHIRKN